MRVIRTSNEVLLRPVTLYVALAYLISWSAWVPLALSGREVVRGDAWPSHVPGLLGPIIAAFIATAILAGRRGVQDILSRMGRWNVEWRGWAVAVSPLAFAAIALPIARLVEGSWPTWPAFGRFNGLPDTGVLGTWALITLLNGFGEETGWRGYLLPHLQRHLSPLAATLIVAVIWRSGTRRRSSSSRASRV